MKTSEWLSGATQKLNAAGVGTARLDCLILLEDGTRKDRAWLLAHPESTIDPKTLRKLNTWIKRRVAHEPLAYIRRKSEFYGRTFSVNPHTLEPRPETETMIDLLKQIISDRQTSLNDEIVIVDVGTGSGCLAVTAKLEFPGTEVIATDISSACLKIARQNAQKLGADIEFLKGDLLKPVSSLLTPYSLLLCNLPYVPDSHTINQAAMFEPKHAIFGGSDGLDLYRKLFTQLSDLAQKPTYIFTETLPFQHTGLAQIGQHFGYKQKTSVDFIQVFQSTR